MSRALDIEVSCPDEATAREIADALLDARLAACCQRGSAVESRYRWNGEIESAIEVPLRIKTAAHLFEAAAARIAELHPYETPAITGMPVVGDEATLRWIEEACIARPAQSEGPTA